MGGPAWTDEEKSILKEHWPEKGSRETAKLLPRRDWKNVLRMAVKIGLKCTDEAKTGIHEKASRKRTEETESCDLNYFKVWTANSAYSIGYIFADAGLSKYRVQFLCHSKDEEIILAMYKEFKCTAKIQRRPAQVLSNRNMGPTTSFRVNSIRFVEYLKDQFGLCERKSFIDLPFPQIPDEYFGHFLRGYFDGDGHISDKKGDYQGGSFSFVGTEQFIRGMGKNVSRLAEVQENKIVENKCKSGAILYSAAWYRHSDLKKIHTLIYPEGNYIFLKRKREVFDRLVVREVKNRPFFTKEEDTILIEKYAELGPTKLSKLMPNRTLGSIWYRAKSLGIKQIFPSQLS